MPMIGMGLGTGTLRFAPGNLSLWTSDRFYSRIKSTTWRLAISLPPRPVKATSSIQGCGTACGPPTPVRRGSLGLAVTIHPATKTDHSLGLFRSLDDRGSSSGFVGHELCEFGGRDPHRLGAMVGAPCLEVGGGHRVGEVVREGL